MGVVEYTCTISIVALTIAFWLEYRDRCVCERRSNPYELIDLQEEMRKKRESKDEDR